MSDSGFDILSDSTDVMTLALTSRWYVGYEHVQRAFVTAGTPFTVAW